jgi:hypothetical protein
MIRVERIVLETDDPQVMQDTINMFAQGKKVLGISAYISDPIYIPIAPNTFERKRYVELFIFFEEVMGDGRPCKNGVR